MVDIKQRGVNQSQNRKYLSTKSTFAFPNFVYTFKVIMPRPLQSLPPEPIEDEDDESRPLLDSEQPSHGTVNINHVVTSDRVVTGNSDPDTTVEDISMIRLLTMLSPLFVLLLLSSAGTLSSNS